MLYITFTSFGQTQFVQVRYLPMLVKNKFHVSPYHKVIFIILRYILKHILKHIACTQSINVQDKSNMIKLAWEFNNHPLAN